MKLIVAVFRRWAKGSREAACEGQTVQQIHFSGLYYSYK